MKIKVSDNTKLWMTLAVIVLVGGLFFGLFAWLVYSLKWWLLIILVGYIVLLSIATWINKYICKQWTEVLYNVVSAPLACLFLLLSLSQAFITVFFTYFLVSLYALGLPALVLIGLNEAGWLGLKPETIAFIVIALGSILCSSSYSITKWIVHHTPLRSFGEHRYEFYREELADYLIHPKNVVFVLYMLYFLFLSVSGFILLQKGAFLLSEGLDTAILKAFLVFIAYTNMRSKAKETEVNVKDLLFRTLLLFLPDRNEDKEH